MVENMRVLSELSLKDGFLIVAAPLTVPCQKTGLKGGQDLQIDDRSTAEWRLVRQFL